MIVKPQTPANIDRGFSFFDHVAAKQLTQEFQLYEVPLNCSRYSSINGVIFTQTDACTLFQIQAGHRMTLSGGSGQIAPGLLSALSALGRRVR